jgi:hypothetical protein
MRKLVSILFFICINVCFGETNPFDKLIYDKVIAYEFQGNGELLIARCLKEETDKINKTRKEIYDFCNDLGFIKYLKPLNSFLDD